MKKFHNLLTTLLFCLFFGGIALLSLVLPDRRFSETENRNLRSLPELTGKKLTNGRFMTEAEDYASDQIAFRDTWVRLKATGELLSGKRENNGIYFAENDTLIRRVEEPNMTALEKNIAYLQAFVTETEVPVYFGLIPSAASIWQEKLPKGAPTAEEEALTQWLYSSTEAKSIDLASVLEAHKEEYIYYRTDHHWTALGAFYGANAILEAMGMEGLRLSDYSPTEVSQSFLGTNYSSAGAWWIEPDTITAYVPDTGKEVMSNFTGRTEEGRLYAPEQLEVKNKYAYFLGGNQPLCVIRSQGEGQKLLVIRDSYSDCLAPFLSEAFGEVHLIDLRYYRLSLQDYIRDNDIDTVLILYNLDTYVTDDNQFTLAR